MKNKNKTIPIPEGFIAEDIKTESSICTSEKIIGFYSAADKKLHYAEFVRSNADIEEFYRKYGGPKNLRLFSVNPFSVGTGGGFFGGLQVVPMRICLPVTS